MIARIRNSVRWRWFALHRRLGRDINVRVGDARLRLPIEEKFASMVYLTGFELAERELVARLLQPGDTVIDVGANVGLYTLLAAGRVGPEGAVHAFEPVPSSVRALEENVARNGYGGVVRSNHAVVSDHVGFESINVPVHGQAAFSSIGAPLHGTGESESLDVPATTLDAYAAEHRVTDVTFVKIDVEGWESRVINGARTLLTVQAPHLMIEFCDAVAESAGSSCSSLYNEIVELGYGFFRYDSQLRRIIPETLRDAYFSDNLLATRRPQEVEARLASAAP